MNKFLLLSIFVFTYSFVKAQQADSTKAVDLYEMSLEDLMNTEVITASKKGEKISDAPATVVVITAEQIKQFGWKDLKDIFRAIPSTDVSYDVQGEIRTLVTMRGVLGNQKILVLQDGQRQNPITGERFVYGNNIPLNFYKRIEIVYGPASALYGAEAYAGVINMITKDGADIDGIEVNTGYVSTNAFVGDIMFGKKVDENTDVIVGARVYNGSDFPLHEEYTDSVDYASVNQYTGKLAEESQQYPIKNWNLFTKIKYKNLTIGADWQHEYETNAPSCIPTQYAYIAKNVWSQDIRHAYATLDVVKKEKFNAHTTLTLGDYTVNPSSNFTIVSGDQSSARPGYKYAHSGYVEGLAQVDWTPCDHFSLIGGASYSMVNSFPKTQNLDGIPFGTNGAPVDDLSQFVDSNGYVFGLKGFTDSLFDVRKYSNIGSFLQAKISPMKELAITLGGRFDYNTDYGVTVNPRIGVVYQPIEKLSIKGMFGTSYIQPSNYYKWENWANPYAMHIPNENIKPETLMSFELSAKYYVTKNTSISFSAFRNNMKNMIVPTVANAQDGGYSYYNPLRPLIGEDPSTGFVEINANVGSVMSQGIEGGFNYRYQNFLAIVSYSFINGDNGDTIFSHINKVSTHKINTNISYQGKKLYAGFTARYYSDIWACKDNSYYGLGAEKEGEKIPGSFIFYVNVGYKILDNLRANISVENILGTKHYGAAPYGESIWIQPRAPQALRKIFVGLSYKF